jgi:hypothetical protein
MQSRRPDAVRILASRALSPVLGAKKLTES